MRETTIGIYDADLDPGWEVGDEVESDVGHRFTVTSVDGGAATTA